jgi:hypothetical protein
MLTFHYDSDSRPSLSGHMGSELGFLGKGLERC